MNWIHRKVMTVEGLALGHANRVLANAVNVNAMTLRECAQKVNELSKELEALKEKTEKKKPMKPLINRTAETKYFCCPVCKDIKQTYYYQDGELDSKQGVRNRYCGKCGCEFDWSDCE